MFICVPVWAWHVRRLTSDFTCLFCLADARAVSAVMIDYKNINTLQLRDRRFRRNSYLQAVCDAPIARVVECVPLSRIVVCCCCSHINSHNQVRGHRTGSSHSGAEEYPREKTHTTQGGTRLVYITADAVRASTRNI